MKRMLLAGLLCVGNASANGTEVLDASERSLDYTAYTLSPGESRLGLFGLDVGLAPGLQVGTWTVPTAVGMMSARMKLAFVRQGPIRLSLGVQGFYMPSTLMFHSLLNRVPEIDNIEHVHAAIGGLTASVRPPGPVAAHASLGFSHVGARVDLASTTVSMGFLAPGPNDDTAEITPLVTAQTVLFRTAVDVRLHERHSLMGAFERGLRAGWWHTYDTAGVLIRRVQWHDGRPLFADDNPEVSITSSASGIRPTAHRVP